MSWFSIVAIAFVLWWLLLFIALPFGLRAQEEEDNDVTLGTMPGAPKYPHLLRAVMITTILTAVIMVLFYVATVRYGFSFDDIPRFIPQYK